MTTGKAHTDMVKTLVEEIIDFALLVAIGIWCLSNMRSGIWWLGTFNFCVALFDFYVAYKVFKRILASAALVDEYLESLSRELDMHCDFASVMLGRMTKEEFLEKHQDAGKEAEG